MSYEGYTQYLCEIGHYSISDCYEDDIENCRCGKPIVWSNMVNVTNGSFDDSGKRIDGYVELKLKSENKCGECGTTLEEIYEIPERKD